MERVFQITAVILIGIAAYFLWQGFTDGVFISAVLGAVAFFLSIRFQVKDRLKSRELEKQKENFAAGTQVRADFENDLVDNDNSATQ